MQDTLQRAIIDLRQTLSQIVCQNSGIDSLRFVLAQRPLRLPSDALVRREKTSPLRIGGREKSNFYMAQHNEEAMHAIRFPYMCCVVEGELEIRLGIPSRQGKTYHVVNYYDILTLPAPCFLIIPPGVLYPDGAPSNYRHLAVKNAKLLYMRIMPSGVFCHHSGSRDGKYEQYYPDIFAPSFQMAMLSDMLIDHLNNPDKDAQSVAQSVFSLMLHHVRHKLNSGTSTLAGPGRKTSEGQPVSSAPLSIAGKSRLVDRACAYIRMHVDKPFVVEDVAGHVFTSVPHLQRLFQAELQTSVMQYAQTERMRCAEALLINSEMSIEEIARAVGYRQPPQFNRAFKKIYQLTPTAFRSR